MGNIFLQLARNIVALRCKLKSVVARITTYLKHCHATKFCCCKLKKFVEKSDASSTCCNMLLQLATTKFCCVTMFEVGGNTCNNAFQLSTQQCCIESCSNLLLVLLVFTLRHNSHLKLVDEVEFQNEAIIHISIAYNGYEIY